MLSFFLNNDIDFFIDFYFNLNNILQHFSCKKIRITFSITMHCSKKFGNDFDYHSYGPNKSHSEFLNLFILQLDSKKII